MIDLEKLDKEVDDFISKQTPESYSEFFGYNRPDPAKWLAISFIGSLAISYLILYLTFR
jgi:hypothetical protein